MSTVPIGRPVPPSVRIEVTTHAIDRCEGRFGAELDRKSIAELIRAFAEAGACLSVRDMEKYFGKVRGGMFGAHHIYSHSARAMIVCLEKPGSVWLVVTVYPDKIRSRYWHLFGEEE